MTGAALLHAETPAGAGPATARGDAAWEKRNEYANGGRAAAAPIGEAVAAYEEALRAAPDDLDVRARLLQALWFQGAYASADNAAEQKVYDHGKVIAEQGLDLLAAATKRTREAFNELPPAAQADAVRAIPGAAETFFWSGVHWGLWGDAFGKLAAARQGVAGKVRDRALVVIALDENLAGGGGHRVLGRLHAVAPHVPFITGWIDRKLAIAELRKALALGPDEPLNRKYLAEALLDHGDAAGRTEAVTILKDLQSHATDPRRAVEWEAAKEDAGKLLAEAQR
jgi:hypothetical protein